MKRMLEMEKVRNRCNVYWLADERADGGIRHVESLRRPFRRPNCNLKTKTNRMRALNSFHFILEMVSFFIWKFFLPAKALKNTAKKHLFFKLKLS